MECCFGFYNCGVIDIFEEFQVMFGDRIEDCELWVEMKWVFLILSFGIDDFEFVQIFFNLLMWCVFLYIGIDFWIDFIVEDFLLFFCGWEMVCMCIYVICFVELVVLWCVFEDVLFCLSFVEFEEDSCWVVELIWVCFEERIGGVEIDVFDFLLLVFICNKVVYVIGCVCWVDVVFFVVLVIVRVENGLCFDDVVMDEVQISIFFSFVCWYFYVDLESFCQVIGFLSSVLLCKCIVEFYILFGYNKYGKMEFYIDLKLYIVVLEEIFV